MRKHSESSIFLLILSAVVAFGWRAFADTLPPGATPISGSAPISVVGGVGIATLSFEVPEGQVFVLTDLEVVRPGSRNIQIFAPEDPDNPRFQGLTPFVSGGGHIGVYQRSFQTGLVFSAAPTVKLISCDFGCSAQLSSVSFSGYFKASP